MAVSVYNRKKQFFAPYAEGLVKQLTGFEEGHKDYNHVLGYVYTNLFEHTFATVDITSVQKSIHGVSEKFKIHGFSDRSRKFLELVDKYLSSDTSQHTQLNVQWHTMLLLLKLSYKPTSISDEELKIGEREFDASVPEESINWTEYLNEGWEKYECCSEDSEDEELWRSALEEEEQDENSQDNPTSSNHLLHLPRSNGSCSYETESFGMVPHPTLWQHPSVPSTTQIKQQFMRQSNSSELWLQSHVQHSWWSDSSYNTTSTFKSRHTSANMCDIWEKYLNSKQDSTESSLLQPIQVISEFKVMKEVLWMLQVSADKGMFVLDENGKFIIKPLLSLSSTIPDSLRLVLEELCPYFNMMRNLQLFEDEINMKELTDKPPPVSYKAYCAALFQQIDKIHQLTIQIEAKLNKQEETMTLMSLVEELMPGLNVLHYLHEVHTRAVTDWNSQPAWFCTTRLLSVLYEALLEACDQVFLETSLYIFIHSFHVYLDIIDVWLVEGRLEDWRKEFLIIREEGCLKVMPYQQEMMKCGVTPVSLLSRLVMVVQDAGHTMEIVNHLNKLPQLREVVQNKGCLFKEFSENVYNEVKRLKENVQEELRPSSEASSESVYESSNTLDIDEGVDLDKTNDSDEEIQKLFPGKNTSFGMCSVMSGLGEGERRCPSYLMLCPSNKYLCDQMLSELLDNRLLREALRSFTSSGESTWRPSAPLPNSTPSLVSCFQPTSSVSLVGLMSMHNVLERQLELVVTRHRTACRLVTQTLRAEYSLLQHFTVLRTVFFMENGILAQSFYSYLFKEIESGIWNNSVGLSVQLQMIVEEFYPGFGNYFSVLVEGGNHETCDVHQAIQIISLAYRVDWPMSLVVTQDMINSYNKVFRFLLHLKYAFWTLHNNHFSDLAGSSNTLRVRRLQVIKMWMFFSTNTLHSYFMGLVLRSFSKHLDKSIRLAESIDVIVQAHNKFLDEVKMHCLQDRKNHIEIFIKKLLRQCSTLADLWVMEASGTLTDQAVQELEEQYTAAYLGLEHCLEAVCGESEAENSLFELKSELSYSAPSSTCK